MGAARGYRYLKRQPARSKFDTLSFLARLRRGLVLVGFRVHGRQSLRLSWTADQGSTIGIGSMINIGAAFREPGGTTDIPSERAVAGCHGV